MFPAIFSYIYPGQPSRYTQSIQMLYYQITPYKECFVQGTSPNNSLNHHSPSSRISYLSHMKKLLLSVIFLIPVFLFAQQYMMTPELLLSLGRVSGIGLSKDKQSIIYSVTTPNVELNKSTKKMYRIPLGGGTPVEVGNLDSLYASNRISPDGKYIILDSAVKLKKVYGKDYYPSLPLSNVQIYESL